MLTTQRSLLNGSPPSSGVSPGNPLALWILPVVFVFAVACAITFDFIATAILSLSLVFFIAGGAFAGVPGAGVVALSPAFATTLLVALSLLAEAKPLPRAVLSSAPG